jgi:MFS family permease
VTRLLRATRYTFRAMSNRNYRLYFVGQLISTSGTWMQSVAQAWLVLRLTGSGVALGVVTALQFTPMLLAGAWGGVVADRVDKRRLLVATQLASGLLAIVLGLVTVTGVVQLWMIYSMAFALGAVNAIDNPARRALLGEMVGTEHLSNAVSLSSAMFTGARVIGPALAGLIIATAGTSWCFFINGLSYGAAVVAFVLMRRDAFFAVEPVPKRKGQLREGLRYAWSTPALRLPLMLTAVIGTFAWNFQVVLPLLAERTFGGDAGTFGTMYALMSVGSVVGALVTARQARATRSFLLGAALAYGVLLVVAGIAPTLGVELLVLVGVGAAGIGFTAMANGVLQTETSPEMRGRVMALFSVAFLGSTPIGGPMIGWLSQELGPRAGLWLGGVTTLAVTAAAIAAIRRRRDVPSRPVLASATHP